MAVDGLPSISGLGSPAGCFPFPRLRTLKVGTEGSMYDSCNLTGHITWKTRDNYMVLRKVQFALFEENRQEEAGV